MTGSTGGGPAASTSALSRTGPREATQVHGLLPGETDGVATIPVVRRDTPPLGDVTGSTTGALTFTLVAAAA